MESFYKAGKLKAIGVSNFEIRHLEELEAEAEIRPHVNQIELHPFFQQKELVEFCTAHGIHITAYSSLGQTVQHSPLLNNRVILEEAEKLQKSPAQVLLKWALNKGFSIVPKSTNDKHIENNLKLDFELSQSVMRNIDDLERNVKFAWDPRTVK